MVRKIEYEESVDILKTMIMRERSAYKVSDALSHVPIGDTMVDTKARDAIADWFIKVVNVCDYNIETAEIAISCLDRFASTPDAKDVIMDRASYQLASLAVLYTSVKVHEREAMSPKFVSKLSGGLTSRKEIENMEKRILDAIHWHVNPPTATSFVGLILKLVSDVFDKESRKLLKDLATLQINFSMVNYDFCTESSSSIAIASLLNAIDGLFKDENLLQSFEALISKTLDLDVISLDSLRKRLVEGISHEFFSEIKQIRREQLSYYQKYKVQRSKNRLSYQTSPKNVTMLQ